jgi:hypothetical protein
MKESISIIIKDLDNIEETVSSIILLNEKIILYYLKKNQSNLIKYINVFIFYFYSIYGNFNKIKGEDNVTPKS